MSAFAHDAKIGERIIQLTLNDSFDMVDLYSSLARQSLETVHHIGSDGSQDILQGGDSVVRGIELHRCTDTILLGACKHRSAVFTSGADAQRPCVALHSPRHPSNGKSVSDHPMSDWPDTWNWRDMKIRQNQWAQRARCTPGSVI